MIGIYNIREGQYNHVIIVEEELGGYRVSFIGLPNSWTPMFKTETTGRILPITSARTPREAALGLAIELGPHNQG